MYQLIFYHWWRAVYNFTTCLKFSKAIRSASWSQNPIWWKDFRHKKSACKEPISDYNIKVVKIGWFCLTMFSRTCLDKRAVHERPLLLLPERKNLFSHILKKLRVLGSWHNKDKFNHVLIFGLSQGKVWEISPQSGALFSPVIVIVLLRQVFT